MSGFPLTASQASTCDLRSAYMVPVFTPRRKLGVLWFGTRVECEAGADDMALMEAVASHMATALESAMASDAYQKQLVAERDRWKLLLDINNHVTAFLDVSPSSGQPAAHFASTSTMISPPSGPLTKTRIACRRLRWISPPARASLMT